MKTIRYLLLTLLSAASLTAMSQNLPDLSLSDINGRQVSLSSLQSEGKPLIVFFYATWCKPAINQLNAITKQYAAWQKETGVKLVVISVDKPQDLQKLKNNQKQGGWKYDVLLDPNGTLKRAMAVQMIPHLFIINAQGETVKSHRGYSEGTEKQLLEELKAL